MSVRVMRLRRTLIAQHAHSVLGLVCVQGYTYFVRYPNDGLYYKILVRFHSPPRPVASHCDTLCCAGRRAAVRRLFASVSAQRV
jgi:hypothetical protein